MITLGTNAIRVLDSFGEFSGLPEVVNCREEQHDEGLTLEAFCRL
jgi:hypothetical protein